MPEARAFWIAAPGRGEIRREPLPTPRDGDIVVSTLFSGISRGTESLVFSGRVPPSEYERMRAPFQSGDFPAPLKYGYATVGRADTGPHRGKAVFALYPHQTQFVIPSAAAHLVPDAVPAARAILAANMETAVNGVWDASIQVGDRVSIVGGGTVGCLVAWIASRIRGCDVELIDINPQRGDVANAIGVRFAGPDDASRERDVVVHASGAPAGLSTALALAAFEGRVIEMSWYGDRDVTVPLGAAFHARRLQIVSSQVGHVATSQRARWDYGRRMRLALDLLADDTLDALITGESAFDELPQVMATLSASPGDTLCHRIRYTQSG